jgi:hypothetical protein
MGDQRQSSTSTATHPAAAERARLDFLASHGGRFFDLQRRLNLLNERALRTGRRAILFVAIAWGVPLLLTLPTLFSDAPTVLSYLKDPGPGARFLIAIAVFILAEQAIETGLKRKLGQFTRAPLIAPTDIEKAMKALNHALRQRDSAAAELACLGLALVAGVIAYTSFSGSSVSNWAAYDTADSHRLTAAGWWCVCVSIPLFVFLFLRGVWRHLVWANLLRAIARLKLRLVSTHPDGKGGLGFLGDYPNAYVLFVFGVSCGMAAAVAKHPVDGGMSATTLTTVMALWLIMVIAFFAYPLSAFSKPLAALKDQTLRTLSARATTLQRAAERKAIGGNVAAPDATEAGQAIEPVDLSKQYEQTRKLSSMLVNRTTLLPVAAAALVPFAITGASRLPYKEVFSVLKKLLLL